VGPGRARATDRPAAAPPPEPVSAARPAAGRVRAPRRGVHPPPVVIHKAHLTKDFIAELRARALEGRGRSFSRFETILPHLWRAMMRARARQPAPDLHHLCVGGWLLAPCRTGGVLRQPDPLGIPHRDGGGPARPAAVPRDAGDPRRSGAGGPPLQLPVVRRLRELRGGGDGGAAEDGRAQGRARCARTWRWTAGSRSRSTSSTSARAAPATHAVLLPNRGDVVPRAVLPRRRQRRRLRARLRAQPRGIQAVLLQHQVIKPAMLHACNEVLIVFLFLYCFFLRLLHACNEVLIVFLLQTCIVFLLAFTSFFLRLHIHLKKIVEQIN
jgi:hypothetical protein